MARTTMFSALALVIAAGCTGEDGISYLTDVTDEPAGTNCATGGVRIDAGPDSNGDGSLAAGEIEDTHYVCASGGVSTLTDVTPEAAGTNCGAGGVRIETGPDTNGNGMLDEPEVASTNYVCGAGEAQIVKAFNVSGVAANTGTPVTLVSASVTTTGPGQVMAIGSTDAFCTPTECPAGTPAATGNMWLSSVDNLGIPAADFDFFYLEPNLSESLTRTLYFPVAAAGTHTFYMRGQDDIGAFTFYRSAITVVFLP